MAIIELDQTFETPVTEYQRGNFKIRYAYSRSRETIEINERGQDFLVFKVKQNQCIFALCDGVGNSFFGGIGSQMLGESLVKWLSDTLSNGKINDNQLDYLTNDLYTYLNNVAKICHELIKNKDLSKFPELQQDAYKLQIQSGGTQSNFTCGFIDGPSEQKPNGQIFLFWLGDARLKIYQNKHDLTSSLNANWNSKEGWASNKGVHGEIHSFCTNINEIDTVISYSDGLLPYENQILPGINADTLSKAIKSLLHLPKSDDVSFIEVVISKELQDTSDDIAVNIRENQIVETMTNIDKSGNIAKNHSYPNQRDSLKKSTANHGENQTKLNADKLWFIVSIILIMMLIFSTFLCGLLTGQLFKTNQLLKNYDKSSLINCSYQITLSESECINKPEIQPIKGFQAPNCLFVNSQKEKNPNIFINNTVYINFNHL